MPEGDDEAAAANSPTWTAAYWAPGSALYVAASSGVVSLVLGGQTTPILRCSVAVTALLADASHLLVGGADGVLRWYGLAQEELDEEASMLWSVPFDAGIKSLTYSPDHCCLLASGIRVSR